MTLMIVGTTIISFASEGNKDSEKNVIKQTGKSKNRIQSCATSSSTVSGDCWSGTATVTVCCDCESAVATAMSLVEAKSAARSLMPLIAVLEEMLPC